MVSMARAEWVLFRIGGETEVPNEVSTVELVKVCRLDISVPDAFRRELGESLSNLGSSPHNIGRGCCLTKRFTERPRKGHRVPARTCRRLGERVVDERKNARAALEEKCDFVAEASEAVCGCAVHHLDCRSILAIFGEPHFGIASATKTLDQDPAVELISMFHGGILPWREQGTRHTSEPPGHGGLFERSRTQSVDVRLRRGLRLLVLRALSRW